MRDKECLPCSASFFRGVSLSRSRISHTIGGSCHLYLLVILLMRAGDIETNPGPNMPGGFVSDWELVKLSELIGPSYYYKVGLALRIPYGQLEGIMKQKLNDSTNALLSVFMKWNAQQNTSMNKREVLADKLQESGLADLSDKLRNGKLDDNFTDVQRAYIPRANMQRAPAVDSNRTFVMVVGVVGVAFVIAGFVEVSPWNRDGHEPKQTTTERSSDTIYSAVDSNRIFVMVVGVVSVAFVIAGFVGVSPWNRDGHEPKPTTTERSSIIVRYVAPPHIVSRQEWGGKEPKSRETMQTPVSFVILLHTVGVYSAQFDDCCMQMRNMQDYHMGKGWDDIGYSFVVGNDGYVYEGRGWNTVGAHTLGHNKKSLGVSVMGDFTTKLPSKRALDGLKYIIDMAVTKKVLTEDYILIGQRQAYPGREGPGNALYKEIQSWPHWKEGNFFPPETQ